MDCSISVRATANLIPKKGTPIKKGYKNTLHFERCIEDKHKLGLDRTYATSASRPFKLHSRGGGFHFIPVAQFLPQVALLVIPFCRYIVFGWLNRFRPTIAGV